MSSMPNWSPMAVTMSGRVWASAPNCSAICTPRSVTVPATTAAMATMASASDTRPRTGSTRSIMSATPRRITAISTAAKNSSSTLASCQTRIAAATIATTISVTSTTLLLLLASTDPCFPAGA